MASFNWKKRISKLETNVAAVFSQVTEEDDEDLVDSVDWLCPTKRPRLAGLEDNVSKSKRLQNEGALLAENERYWEAVKYWDEAIELTPNIAALHEMKSQVLLELEELFPAVQSAERAVQLDPQWAIAKQTLGRAQLGLGELEMARQNFQKAVHLLPSNEGIRADLSWTVDLLKEKATKEGDTKKK